MHYVLVRKELPLSHHGKRVLSNLSDEAQAAYRILKEHKIDTGETLMSSLDEERYGIFDIPKIPEGLQKELDEKGFYLEGPFKNYLEAAAFWCDGHDK